MTYTFKSEILNAQIESAILTCVEGDNEIAIIDVCSNFSNPQFALVVMTIENDEEVCIREEFCDSLKEAIGHFTKFITDEYAGAE